MKKQLKLLLCFLMLSFWGFAQEYQYEVSTLIPQGANIIDDGLTIDENGTLYGSYWGIWQGAAGTHVLRYYTDGTYDTLATGLLRPNGLAYINGKIYVGNSGNGQLIAVDMDGTKEVIANIPGGISQAVQVPGTDSLIVTGWAQSRLFGVNAEGDITAIHQSTLYDGAVGAAYDEEGRLYIGNFNDGKILKLEDGELEVLADLGGGIGFLTYSDGAILATNHTDKKVYRVSLDGSEIEVIAGSGEAVIQDGIGEEASFMSPNGIVSTPSGDTIYVSEFMGKALRMIVRTTVSSTKEITSESKAVVYPNPSSGMITIKKMDMSKVGQGILRDSSGRTVKVLSASALKSGAIDVADLVNGQYSLSLVGRDEVIIDNLMFTVVR